jgi:hypothetical protein
MTLENIATVDWLRVSEHGWYDELTPLIDWKRVAIHRWKSHKLARHGTFGKHMNAYVDGNGPIAVVALCNGIPKVTLHQTLTTAALEFDLLDGLGDPDGIFAQIGCSLGCQKQHKIVDMRHGFSKRDIKKFVHPAARQGLTIGSFQVILGQSQTTQAQ